MCSPAHTWCLHISKYQECWSLAVIKDFAILANTAFVDIEHLRAGGHISKSTDAHGVKNLLLCPESPISMLNKSYIPLMEVVSAQHGCPDITISNNNGNGNPPLPITQNTFNPCRQEKKNLIFQLFQYIRLSSSVGDLASKISEVFQSTKQHFIPNYLAKKPLEWQF